MKLLIQRVSSASVKVNKKITGLIGNGLLALVAFAPADTSQSIDQLTAKMLNLRIFSDANDKMNLSIKDVKGELLIVSQFTLYADCKKGNRPSFTDAAKPEQAKKLYKYFIEKSKESGLKVETGEFGANMQISLVNDGPVTIILDIN